MDEIGRRQGHALELEHLGNEHERLPHIIGYCLRIMGSSGSCTPAFCCPLSSSFPIGPRHAPDIAYPGRSARTRQAAPAGQPQLQRTTGLARANAEHGREALRQAGMPQ